MSARRPIIAITPDSDIPEGQPTEAFYVVRVNYAAAVLAAGGTPVILPYAPEAVAEYIATFDGFLITGGTPGVSTKPGRSDFETALIKAAIEAGRPLLGICNGMQLIGRALGGRFVESIKAEVPQALEHIPFEVPTQIAHDIQIVPKTLLSTLAGAPTAKINSLHQQAIAGPGQFTVAATAPDGVTEAIEGHGSGFCLGLQWHPEYRLTPLDIRIFEAFIEAAKR